MIFNWFCKENSVFRVIVALVVQLKDDFGVYVAKNIASFFKKLHYHLVKEGDAYERESWTIKWNTRRH